MTESRDNGVAALRVPHRLMEFLQKNPKLAEVVGEYVVQLMEMFQVHKEITKRRKDIAKKLSDSEEMKKHLEFGTEKQMKDFIFSLCMNLGSGVIQDGLTEEEMKEVARVMVEKGDGKVITTELRK